MSETLFDLWKAGEQTREPFIERARRVAAVTLPYLAPHQGRMSGEDLPDPYQSIGSRGVSNLASKLTLSLFPTQAPFFRYEVDPVRYVELGGDPKAVSEAQVALSRRERQIQRKLDTTGFRPRAYEAFLHLLVAGSFLLRFADDATVTGYRLDQFQVQRDGQDRVESILLREVVHKASLPPAVLSRAPGTTMPGRSSEKETDLFTGVFRDPSTGRWRMHQEVGGVVVPGTVKDNLSDADMPFLVLRLIPDEIEHYGRSVGEVHLGDLQALEGLTQSLLESAAIASKCVFLVNPGSQVTPEELARAENGGFRAGKDGDVTPVQSGKISDFQFVFQMAEQIRQRLEVAFLLQTAVRRDAERVTATEIQVIAQELDETLGGVFGLLAAEFQVPLVQKIQRRMERKGELFEIDDKVAGVKLRAGLDALGRGRNMIALSSVFTTAQQIVGPEAVAKHINVLDLFRRLMADQGVDPQGLVLTEEELGEAEQQRQISEFIQRIGPNGVKLIENLALQQGQQPPE